MTKQLIITILFINKNMITLDTIYFIKIIPTHPKYFNNTKIEELNNSKNSSDYEAMWEIAIDKWTRNWNFYRERLTDSILNKFDMNNKRQKRQTQIDFVELTGQNINGSATGPQDIFIKNYDCDAE